MSLADDPAADAVLATGGVGTVNLANAGAAKLPFQVRCSNNTECRLEPVFGFVDDGEITCLAGAPKEDKLVIQFLEAPADAADAQALFARAAPQSITVPIKAE